MQVIIHLTGFSATIIDLVWIGFGSKEDICTVNEDPKVAVDFFFKSQLL